MKRSVNIVIIVVAAVVAIAFLWMGVAKGDPVARVPDDGGIAYDAVVWSDSIVRWALAALAAFVSARVIQVFLQGRAQAILGRLWTEVMSSVQEVWQTYVGAIKAARVDGKLTPEEKLQAREMALNVLKGNLGQKGLAKLGRVLGFDGAILDRYLTGKIEAAVAESKVIGTAAGSKTSGTKVVGAGLPLPLR